MSRPLLAAPAVRRPPAPAHDVNLAALVADLRAADVDAEIRFDAGSRAAYSTDASNYRMVPLGVVVPRSVEAVPAIVEVCRRHGAPIVSRGGGTSLAGQCTNTAVVLDWSKYCHHVLEVDPEGRTCLVEPGIVLDALNEHLRPAGLAFGPRPATHDHCTLGGMIGNNSCGATAQRWGKVVDNVVELEVLLYDGTRMWVGETSDAEYERIQRSGGRRAEIYRQLRMLRDTYLSQLRTGYPQIPRRVSGYNLDSLLPEKNFHVAQALVGSEGTLVTVLRARLRLVPTLTAATMVFLAYPSIVDAADAVPAILPHHPVVLEGIDDTLIHFERLKHLNETGIGELPSGGAWLMVQLGGETKAEADAAVDDLLRSLGRRRGDGSVHIFEDVVGERRMWDVREAGLGSTARVPGQPDTWPGWEDSAVAPERLGDYLRDLTRLFRKYGLEQVSVYGHFGHGCVHCRIPFDLYSAEGVRRFRSFLEQAADLVVSYGGSLSGEHGDGQARAELLTRMFGPDLVRAFGQFKAIFDPDDRMNPGKVIPPYPLDEHLRIGAGYHHDAGPTYFRYPDDDHSFGRAVLRCVGVGKCRRHHGGVMCPSYMVTREEKHSTRGRSRLLFEMLDGTARGGVIADGWRSEAVLEALDLCLACKGCKSDCPVNVDMATYKAEFLAHHYQGRLRPASHYSMGWLPLWAALAAVAPGAVNALVQAPGINRLVKRLGGVDARRDIPPFAAETFQAWFRRHVPRGDGRHGEVLLWPDTFTNHFHPAIGQAAVAVLEAAGWRVTVPAGPVCCGLTWISTGQLTVARAVLRRTVTALRPYLDAGVPVVGLEPSCTAVLRSDARELFPDDPDVLRLRDQTGTLAELLNDRTPDWQPPLVPGKAIVQTHCHQHAILGTAADAAVLARIGVDARFLDSGCCGLAGNFGFEQGHYDVSVACAERVLLPAVRDAPEETVVLADGIAWASTTMVLAEASADGVTGMGWTYGPAAVASVVTDLLAPAVEKVDPDDVPAAWLAMQQRLRNVGRPGIAGLALSAADNAIWDLKARRHGLPLARLLGAVRHRVPVYGSGGFTTYDEQQQHRQLVGWTEQGIPRVKIKIAESWGSDEARDLARMAAARRSIGDRTELFVDANGGYHRKQAVRVMRAAADLDVRWFEEPVSSDDLDGLAHVRDHVSADVAAGEYGYDLAYFQRMAGSVDCLQVDVTRCGGISEFLRVAATAAATGLDVSAHGAPHQVLAVAAAVPNLRHIEWFHDHVRIETMLFDGSVSAAGGTAPVNRVDPGTGLAFRAAIAEPYRVR